MEKYDAIVLGFGKGGKTLAAELSGRGWTVAVVEKSKGMYGGTCINIGCIPTKTLVHQAKLATAHDFASWEERAAFYRQAIDEKKAVTSALRAKNYHNLADRETVTVIDGEGSFLSPTEVVVKTADGEMKIEGKYIFINTGSESVIPPIEGVQNNPKVFTSTSLLELTELPKRLVIIGGGYIGLEFASMYAAFGSKVTVLESYDSFIGREDRDIAEAVKTALEKRGVEIRLNARVQEVTKAGGVVYLDAETNEKIELEGDAVLLATGRRPMTRGLNLEVAGVELGERGEVKVDGQLHTSQSHIYAMGDVKGGLQFTYISLDDYRIVRDDLFGEKVRTTADRNPVSYSVFIDPQLARIGLGEEDARKAGLDFDVKKLPVAAIPRAKTLGEPDGLFKALVEKGSGRILGCTLFGPEAGEIINIVAMAMKAGLPASFLHNFIFTHPSMSEALNDLF